MNKPLRRVAIFAGLLVLALLARVNWLQFVQAEELRTNPDNRRVAIERYSIPRGDIIVGDQSVTGHTETTSSDFKYKRTWKDGPLWAPITGYASQAFGTSQLESINDGILTGTDDRLFFDRTIDMITGEDKQGGDVVTTINANAQKAAYEGLKGKKGAAVAIDPKTGAILALVSTPSYDPSTFAGNSDKDSEAWTELNKNPDKPMLNRALRETYPPGSTFKVVTAAAALENGEYDIDEKTGSDPNRYKLPLTTDSSIPNPIQGKCDDVSMEVGLQWSCNTVFAKVSDELGNEKMIEQAEKFGFNAEQFVPIRSAESVYPEMDRPQNAMGGIGQSSVRATPLQMAMVASAVANDGKLMKPYLVKELKAPNLDTIERADPQELSQAVSEENAKKLQQGMETVVRDGTGQPVQLPNATVGGKTGTAQHGAKNEALPYAWMITYAKGENGQDVAVAVVVEDGSADREQISGSGIAGPIAKSVMQAVVGQ